MLPPSAAEKTNALFIGQGRSSSLMVRERDASEIRSAAVIAKKDAPGGGSSNLLQEIETLRPVISWDC
jgi:hypothetical protein